MDESKAYGYALDAYLEGVSEFWGHVESIREEDDDDVEEEQSDIEAEEDNLPPMGEEGDAGAGAKQRASLAPGLAANLKSVLDESEVVSGEGDEARKAEAAGR